MIEFTVADLNLPKSEPEKMAALVIEMYDGQTPVRALDVANRLGRWTSVDEAAIRKAWDERRRAHDEACVLVPSSVLFERSDLRGEQIVYADGYQIAAARTRGRVHGREFVRQCWEDLVQRGVDLQAIGPLIIAPWVEHVAEWVARDIDPERINPGGSSAARYAAGPCRHKTTNLEEGGIAYLSLRIMRRDNAAVRRRTKMPQLIDSQIFGA